MKWCEHMDPVSKSFHLSENKTTPIINMFFDREIIFCPMCGTPKPKDETLEEKFEEELKRMQVLFPYKTLSLKGAALLLANIAREHFKDLK